MIGAGANPLAAALLGPPSPSGRRLAPGPVSCALDPSPAVLDPAAAESSSQGQSSDRASSPRPPVDAASSSSSSPPSSPGALRVSPQLSRWNRGRALRSGRRLPLVDRAAAVSAAPAPAVTARPPQTPSLLHDDLPAVAPEVEDGLCEAEIYAAAGKAIYLVSDGTGWTAEHSVNAALGQFEHCLVDRGCAVSTHLFSGVNIPPRLRFLFTLAGTATSCCATGLLTKFKWVVIVQDALLLSSRYRISQLGGFGQYW